MKKIARHFLFLPVMLLAGSCSVQNRFVQTELYFGLSQSNGKIIPDSSWNVFVQKDVSEVFSEGFTIIHSEGKWVDEQQKAMHSEPSRIVTAVSTMTTSLSAKIDSLRERYKTLFQQEAVLRVDKTANIDF